jgi:RNA polymerase sigma-70 factor, ECF subfamily
MSSSDLAFVARAQQGDAGAFDYLVLRHRHELLRLIARYVRDPAQAEEIAQETFDRAYRALASFPRNSAFFAWLSRFALDFARSVPDARSRQLVADVPAPAVELLEPEAQPAERLELTDEVREAVRATIERLPREFKTALVLRETQGLSYDEIAAQMNCPARTVRSFIFLAREVIDSRVRVLLEPPKAS